MTAANSIDGRILPADAIELFRAVHELCGAGAVRDRDWWAIESEWLGTDWRGIDETTTMDRAA